MKTLIFEDEYPIAFSLREHLTSLGYKDVMMVENLEKAYKIIDENYPDIAILDIRIPNDNEAGIKVAKYLKNRKNIPIIFMTANDDELVIERALGTKPDAYLSKAFNESIIYYSIERAIENLAKRKNASIEKDESTSSYIFGTEDFILFKKKRTFHSVKKKDIIYVHSEGGAIRIFTEETDFPYSSTLSVFLSQIHDNCFIKIGRNHIINIVHFEAFLDGNRIQVKGMTIKLKQSEYKKLFNLFKVFRSKNTSQ